MQLQDKLQQTAEITYLEAKKSQGRCLVIYLMVSKVRTKVRLMFKRPKESIKDKSYVFPS